LTDVHSQLEAGDHIALKPRNPLYFGNSGARTTSGL
jgi:hypothetical protein